MIDFFVLFFSGIILLVITILRLFIGWYNFDYYSGEHTLKWPLYVLFPSFKRKNHFNGLTYILGLFYWLFLAVIVSVPIWWFILWLLYAIY